MYPSQINKLQKEVEWWENKNEGKEVIYDLDFEIEMVEHVKHGEILEVDND